MNKTSTQEAARLDSAPKPAKTDGLLSNWREGRLTDAVIPETYDLRLAVDPQAETFSGRVTIRAKISRPISALFLHALELAIHEARINGTIVPSGRIVLDQAFETAKLSLDKPLQAGEASIEFAFAGKLNRHMEGLYLSTNRFKGQEEKYAFTQFEPTDARRMFPCFDEPAFKAKFNLTVTAPAELKIISNALPQEEKANGKLRTVRFHESPRMSTYLLAVFAARLESSKVRRTAGTELRAWATPEKLELADFSLDEGARALQLLADYFQVPYPLPKMDIVAVPDFAMGAMENWGAVSFRDTAMLVDSKLASTNALRRISEVVTHEFVHQWFGNLVTMKWWNDLWLNESFATWVAYKMVDRMRPEWRIWFEFEDGKALPLRLDSLKSARPISSSVVTSAEIEAQFDGMSYQKGAAILRMLENDLGEEPFRRGIRLYLTRHQYANADAADFWAALGEASGKPVASVAHDWLTQTGFPLVRLELQGQKLQLTHTPSLASGKSREKKSWNVPVVLRYRLAGENEVRTHRILLSKDAPAAEFDIPNGSRLLWAYPNSDQSGYYRVSLSHDLSAALRRHGADKLPTIEKTGYLSDLWAQSRNGTLPLSDFLDALEAFGRSEERPMIEAASGYLAALDDIFSLSSQDKKRLADLTLELMSGPWLKLGWEPKPGENDEAKLSRVAALGALGKIAPSKKLLAEVKSRLKEYLKDPASLDPTLAGTLLTLSARNGDAALFNRFVSRMKTAATPQDRNRFMGALAEFRRPALAKKLVALSLSEDIRPQDLWMPLILSLRNRDAQAAAWELTKSNWQKLRARAGSNGSTRIISGADLLLSRAWLKDVKAFFSSGRNRVPEADRTLKQTLEKIELNLSFREKQSKHLSAWLKARRPDGPPPAK